MSAINTYMGPQWFSYVPVAGYYADTFGMEVTCPECGERCEVEHDCGMDECSTYLVSAPDSNARSE
jgi:hypothetical protein